MKVRLTKAASADIRTIYDYLASESPLARMRFEERLEEIMVDIRDFPATGHQSNKSGVRIKNTHPYPYLVFYRVKPSEVLVVRVRHGARNPKSMPARPR